MQFRAGRLLHATESNVPQPASCHAAPSDKDSRHHLLVKNIPIEENVLFIICCFSLQQISYNFGFGTYFRNMDPRGAILTPVRFKCFTCYHLLLAKLCVAVGHYALAHEKTPTSCCTHLHNQTPVLLRLTEVCAHFKGTHRSFLTQVHPGVVFFTLWQSIPECLEDFPDCFLTH